MFTKEAETIKKNPQILELKNTMNEIKNVTEGICSKVEQMEDRMYELSILVAIETSLTPGDTMNK